MSHVRWADENLDASARKSEEMCREFGLEDAVNQRVAFLGGTQVQGLIST